MAGILEGDAGEDKWFVGATLCGGRTLGPDQSMQAVFTDDIRKAKALAKTLE